MPRSKNPAQYPQAFEQAFREACLRPFIIPCASEPDARRLMGRLYSYVGAVRHASGKNPELKEIDAMLSRVQLRVEGTNLLLRPQDQDPDAQLVLTALTAGANGTASSDIRPSSVLAELATQGLTSERE